jgi:hypothetical protein
MGTNILQKFDVTKFGYTVPHIIDYGNIKNKIKHFIYWHFIAYLASCFFDSESYDREVTLVPKAHELKLHYNL